MCLEDIRLGRQSRAAMVVKQIPAVAGVYPVVPPNKYRIALIFPAQEANLGYWLYGINEDVGRVGFSLLGTNDEPTQLVLNVQQHGALVTGPWSFRNPSATVRDVCYFETILEVD